MLDLFQSFVRNVQRVPLMLIAHESGHLSYSLLDQVQVSLSITSVRPLLELCKHLCNNLLLSCHVQNDDETSVSKFKPTLSFENSLLKKKIDISINDGLNSVVCAIAVILATFDSMLPNNHICLLHFKRLPLCSDTGHGK